MAPGSADVPSARADAQGSNAGADVAQFYQPKRVEDLRRLVINRKAGLGNIEGVIEEHFGLSKNAKVFSRNAKR